MAGRIIVISEDLSEPWGDGVKTFAVSVATAFAREAETTVLSINGSAMGTKLRARIREIDPDVVVYVPADSCTSSSFWRCFSLRHFHRRALIGMVALKPVRHHALTRPLIQGSQPDRTFVTSYRSLLYMNRIGVSSEVVSSGVDLACFRRASKGQNEREVLRQRYSVSPEAYVYLHVGRLVSHRHLEVMGALAVAPGTEVIAIDDPRGTEEAALRAALEAAGVRVIRDQVPVEEFYRLADCYVFPAYDAAGCVEVPLTVLEALASGLPVLSRPFGGLRDFLPPGADVRYWDDETELASAAAELRAGSRLRVRDMGAFAWPRVAERILFGLEKTAA